MSAKQDVVKKLMLSAMSLILLAGSAEIYLRVRAASSQRSYTGRAAGLMAASMKDMTARRIHEYFYTDKNGAIMIYPGAVGFHKSYDEPDKAVIIRINSLGLRGEEPDGRARKRIAFIGDSIVFDGGVPLEKTFVRMLEDGINALAGGDDVPHADILNCGTSDSGIDQYYLRLKHHISRLECDYIFLGFYLNDAVDPQGYLGSMSPGTLEKILESGIISRLHIARKLKHIFRRLKYSSSNDLKKRFRWAGRFNKKDYYRNKEDLVTLVSEADMDWGAAWIPGTWEKVGYYLRMIKETVEDSGARLVIFSFPAEPQVNTNVDWEDLDYPQRMLAEKASEIGVVYHSLMPYIKKSAAGGIFADQCHYTAAGNALVARSLLDIITGNREDFPGLIPEKE